MEKYGKLSDKLKMPDLEELKSISYEEPAVVKMSEIDSVKQKPCEDAVSREEAFEELNSLNGTAELDMAFEVIEKLPSVTPTRKKGKWIAKSFHEVYCDNCKFDFDIMTNEFIDKMKYCPNCGAKMEGEKE